MEDGVFRDINPDCLALVRSKYFRYILIYLFAPSMFPTYLKSLLCLTLQLPIVLSHPADLSVRADNEFIFAAIGDSWAVS